MVRTRNMAKNKEKNDDKNNMSPPLLGVGGDITTDPETSDNPQPSSSKLSRPPCGLGKREAESRTSSQSDTMIKKPRVKDTKDKRYQLHHGNHRSLPTSPEGKIESNEDPNAIGSDLQLYNQSFPGTSKSICPIGGTISTGSGQIKITGKQAVDLIQGVAPGWDRTMDKQDDREIHVHLSKTEIKDSVVTVGGNITVNPAGRKPKKPPTKQSPQTPLQRLRVQTERRIEEWTDGMVHTAATQTVIDKILQGKTWVIVTGSPGEGKTTAAYLTLKHLHDMGRQVYEIATPEDYFKVKDSNGPIILLNDIFGSSRFNEQAFEDWRTVLNDLFELKEHRDMENLEGSTNARSSPRHRICIILVSRTSILNSVSNLLERMKDLFMDHESVVDLTRDVKASRVERCDIWKYYAEKYKVKIDDKTLQEVFRMSLSHGFPHCCRLFASMYSRDNNLSMELFFSRPLEFLNQFMQSLFQQSTTESLLRQMLKHDGCLDLDAIDDERRCEYLRSVERLKGTYLSEIDNTVKFHHPSIYDSAAFIVCKKDPLFVIQHCSLTFLNERIRFKDLDHQNNTESHLTLPISFKYTENFIKRLKTEISNGNISLALSHVSFHDKSFVERLMEALHSESKISSKTDFIQWMLHKEDRECKQSFLFLSTIGKSDNVLKHLCNVVDLSPEEQIDALFGTCEHSSISSMQFLLNTYENIPLNEQNSNLKTPILVAATKGSAKILKMLILNSADMAARDKEGKSVLYHVCVNGVDGDGDVVHNILDKNGENDWRSKEYLYVASSKGHANVVKVLTERGADINKTHSNGLTPLHAACLRGHVNVVTVLIDSRVDINQTTTNGATSFHAACQEGHVNVMTALIDRGVDINQTTTDGRTPLHFACQGGHVNVMTALIDRGVDINQTTTDGRTPLHFACLGGHVNVMTALIDRGVDINQTTTNGRTPLHFACGGGHVNVMTALIDRGVDMNQTTTDGTTPLHFACGGGHVNVMTALIDKGVDINQMDSAGRTPLHWACQSVQVNAVKTLLSLGSDASILDSNGKTPFDQARKKKHIDVVKAIMDHMN